MFDAIAMSVVLFLSHCGAEASQKEA
jgi:hypothetical protein